MWSFAIFCEYPGCQANAQTPEDGELPAGWFAAYAGDEDDPAGLLGTFCGWEHFLVGLQNMAPATDRVDVRTPAAAPVEGAVPT